MFLLSAELLLLLDFVRSPSTPLLFFPSFVLSFGGG